MRKLFLAAGLVSFCMAAIAAANTIHLKDGRVYENVTIQRELDDFFVFQAGDETHTLEKQRIDRIVGKRGRILFTSMELTVQTERFPLAPTQLIFLVNKQETARAYWDEKGRFTIIAGEIPDGLYKQYYDSGILEREYTIADGKPNGEARVYYESGRLQREGTFNDGMEDGESRIYYENGNIKGVSLFKAGKRQGKTMLYHESGKLHAELNFVDSKAEGVQKMHYENGALETVVHFKNGLRHGSVRQYYPGGELKMEGAFKGGKPDGLVVTYHASGRERRRQQFVDGVILKGLDQ